MSLKTNFFIIFICLISIESAKIRPKLKQMGKEAAKGAVGFAIVEVVCYFDA